MRHGAKFNHLGRTASHRHALLSGLACELIRHKRIVTTLAKAKSLRVYVEPLITKSKTNTTHQRRVVFSYLNDKEAVTELFSTVSEKIATRPGGYTRIIKLGKRLGDAAEMAMIELVDFNEVYSNEAPAAGKKKRTRRSGSSKKKASTDSTVENHEVEPAAEEIGSDESDSSSATETPAADKAEETPAAEETTAESKNDDTDEKKEEKKEPEA